MAFMIPVYYEDAPFLVTCEDGTDPMVPSFVCDSDDPRDFADYVDGTPVEVERLPKGIVFRLSAPGYMDCTDWDYAPTLDAARKSIEETYEVNPDTGNDLGEEEDDA